MACSSDREGLSWQREGLSCQQEGLKKRDRERPSWERSSLKRILTTTIEIFDDCGLPQDRVVALHGRNAINNSTEAIQ